MSSMCNIEDVCAFAALRSSNNVRPNDQDSCMTSRLSDIDFRHAFDIV